MREIKLFISSTGDLSYERLVCHEVIEMINLEHSRDFEIKLIKWETHSNPIVISTFQEEINKELIKADIVCFIFHNRLGKHTHEEYDFVSQNHIRRFVLQKEYSPKLSLLAIEDIERYLELRRFTDAIGDILGKYTFDNIDGFKLALRDCLGKYIANILATDANASRIFQSRDPSVILVNMLRNNPDFINEFISRCNNQDIID